MRVEGLEKNAKSMPSRNLPSYCSRNESNQNQRYATGISMLRV